MPLLLLVTPAKRNAEPGPAAPYSSKEPARPAPGHVLPPRRRLLQRLEADVAEGR